MSNNILAIDESAAGSRAVAPVINSGETSSIARFDLVWKALEFSLICLTNISWRKPRDGMKTAVNAFGRIEADDQGMVGK